MSKSDLISVRLQQTKRDLTNPDADVDLKMNSSITSYGSMTFKFNLVAKDVYN
jgi:hypothetical protein